MAGADRCESFVSFSQDKQADVKQTEKKKKERGTTIITILCREYAGGTERLQHTESKWARNDFNTLGSRQAKTSTVGDGT